MDEICIFILNLEEIRQCDKLHDTSKTADFNTIEIEAKMEQNIATMYKLHVICDKMLDRKICAKNDHL